MGPAVLEKPTTKVALEPMYELVLFNDEIHTLQHVVEALSKVIGHPPQLGERLALEAHRTGKSIIEVGPKTKMLKYRDILRDVYALTVEVQPIN